MSVVIKGEISALEKHMIQGIKDCQREHIKFTNTSFRCETIEDADGNIFKRLKKGKWIWDDEGYHCSECFFHAHGNTLECLDGTYSFCPNCGADMRGEEK